MRKINESFSKKSNSGRSLNTWLQICGVIIALIAALVTAFLSIRSERTKELTVSFLAKLSLISIEGGRRNIDLEIRHDGTRIQSPWLLSGRLENTGNQPIEDRDIEAPVKFSFSQGKVIGADITQKSQQAILARSFFNENDVTIQNKLLNPGDWINFDILFDGEPNVPPLLSLRISGVSKPKQLSVSLGEKRPFLTIVPVPMPVLYLLLTIVSLIGIAGVCIGFVFLVDCLRDIVFRPLDTEQLNLKYRFYTRKERDQKFTTEELNKIKDILSRNDLSDLLGALAFIIIVLSIILFLGGTWRTLLSY